MEVLENFFNNLKEEIPQILIGHVIEKVGESKYKVRLAKGRRGEKGVDECEVECIYLLPSIQSNRGVYFELKVGERVLLLYTNKTYFILGSLVKEEQKNFVRIDEYLFDVEERRVLVLKPQKITEIVVTEDEKFVVRTKNQKFELNPNENVVKIKTNQFEVVIDEKRFVVDAKNNLQILMDKESDKILLKTSQNFGIKVEGRNVEVRGEDVNFYNTPFS